MKEKESRKERLPVKIYVSPPNELPFGGGFGELGARHFNIPTSPPICRTSFPIDVRQTNLPDFPPNEAPFGGGFGSDRQMRRRLAVSL
ncbi:hypothetical protein [Fundicoccus culcitae]|uniref:Uncharacterized protein n=1 Tax=Fundicoccus culcitae TaxID=2969821 RepID=A0ABY5P9A3_9LACT|nr:hypothetical protein [Fundicoccus culcitae]UUX35331.1 hypothetical protein NRE15_06715 [Fundicoccus culcitae]